MERHLLHVPEREEKLKWDNKFQEFANEYPDYPEEDSEDEKQLEDINAELALRF